jgi:bifunctional non-homologous end joining protein LigD
LIYVDYLRNVEGATAVAAYSVRAKARAPVAMPIDWAGLGKKDVRFDCYNLRNVPGIVAKRKRDPWERLPKVRQALTDEMLAKVGIAASTRRR